MRKFTALPLIGLIVLAPAASACGSKLQPQLCEDEAIRDLTNRVLADNLYPWVRQADCLNFIVEFATQTTFLITVRERHDPQCSGDATTATVIDQFQVVRRSREVSRYDAATDTFVPYTKLTE